MRALPVEHGDEIAAADYPVVGVEVGVHEAGRADIGHRRPQPGVQGAARAGSTTVRGSRPTASASGRRRPRAASPPARPMGGGVAWMRASTRMASANTVRARCGRAALGEDVAGRGARHPVHDEVRGAEPRAVLAAPPQPRHGHAVLGQRGEQRGLPVHVGGGAAARPQRRHAQHQAAPSRSACRRVERPGDARVARHPFEAGRRVRRGRGCRPPSAGAGPASPWRRPAARPRLLSRGRHRRRPRRASTAWPP